MKNTEKVLCVKRESLPEEWVREKSVVRTDAAAFFKICAGTGHHWMERGVVEQDPSFKQIIPYTIVQTQDGSRTAVYKRKGSEKRLHDLWSAGVGGHINPEDKMGFSDSFEGIVRAGMARELAEEFAIRPENSPSTFLGIINEEATDVGRVHLGAVFRIMAARDAEFVPGSELVDFQWMDTSALHRLNMELWSMLTLELLSLHGQPGGASGQEG